jgi:hypothetical protein
MVSVWWHVIIHVGGVWSQEAQSLLVLPLFCHLGKRESVQLIFSLFPSADGPQSFCVNFSHIPTVWHYIEYIYQKRGNFLKWISKTETRNNHPSVVRKQDHSPFKTHLACSIAITITIAVLIFTMLTMCRQRSWLWHQSGSYLDDLLFWWAQWLEVGRKYDLLSESVKGPYILVFFSLFAPSTEGGMLHRMGR